MIVKSAVPDQAETGKRQRIVLINPYRQESYRQAVHRLLPPPTYYETVRIIL
jgi:hypothetical protein